ncbi:hypothetical protein [Sphingosinicella sp. LY1275]|uniref:hypothetical protein n=1 Tax=Sphingosinicella sp. LY1275 TaxID=3095379 RepID=UPI002ADEC3A3|nr:hypothetical protein [Sphingosinicella sp. LY1275]MEA1014711.1 hypothetical protein [Sphingosinicella sp. LY1275]
MRFVTAWLWRPIKQGLETLLRFGVRPSAETILQIDVDQFPGIGALGREQVASSKTRMGSVFPEGETCAPRRTSTDAIKRQPSNDSI